MNYFGSSALVVLGVLLFFVSIITFVFDVKDVSMMDSIYLFLFSILMYSAGKIYDKISDIHKLSLYDYDELLRKPNSPFDSTSFYNYSATITPDVNGNWKISNYHGPKEMGDIVQNILNNMVSNSNTTDYGFESKSKEEKIELLEKAKNKALKEENYEYVAEIQKRIESLKGEDGNSQT